MGLELTFFRPLWSPFRIKGFITIEFLHAVIPTINYVDMVIHEEDILRIVKFKITIATCTKLTLVNTVCIKDLDTMIISISDIDEIIFIYSYSYGLIKFTIAITFCSPCCLKSGCFISRIYAEFLYAVITIVCNINITITVYINVCWVIKRTISSVFITIGNISFITPSKHIFIKESSGCYCSSAPSSIPITIIVTTTATTASGH